MLKIVVTGLDGCLGSSFLGLTDLMTLAQRAITNSSLRSVNDAQTETTGFCAVTASLTGQQITAVPKMLFDVETSFDEVASCDAIIIPSFAPTHQGKPPDMSIHASTAAWLRRHHSRGAIIGGCGSGVFLLGEAISLPPMLINFIISRLV